MTTVNDVYSACELEDPLSYSQCVYDRSGSCRGIVSTTWMCAHIVSDLFNGKSCSITSDNLLRSKSAFDMVVQMLRRVQLSVVVQKCHWDTVKVNNDAKLNFCANASASSTPFNDHVWTGRLSCLVLDPFDAVYEIKRVDGRNVAYTGYGDRLMELPDSGVRQILEMNDGKVKIT